MIKDTKKMAIIAAAMYDAAEAIESNVLLDEKWRTASKLKNAANDAYFYVAQVVGAGAGQSPEFDCTYARKNLSAIKAMYTFAAKQNMIELDPEIVVQIDRLITEIDKEQRAGQDYIKQKAKEDLEPWLEKYRIWQKISKD